MSRSGHRQGSCHEAGMTLLELLIAMALSSLLLLGLVQIVAAASTASRLQDNQGQLEDTSRYAIELLGGAVRQATFNPQPWNDSYDSPGLTENTIDAIAQGSDRLTVRSWSDLNCFNNRNPATDSEGTPLFYIRESTFDLSSSNNLAHSCSYGPSPEELSIQIRRQGLITGVESFQLLFGEDANHDGQIERWVNAGQWLDRQQVLGVRFGMLLAADEAVTDYTIKEYMVLDSRVRPRNDGKLRRLVQFTIAIRGRTG